MKKLIKYTLVGLTLLFYCVVFTFCKKKKKTPIKPYVIEQPAPIGAMEGKYKWYSGDSATVDLVLTTNVINCQHCTTMDADYYNCNLVLAQNQPPYLATIPTGTKMDTIIIFKNSKYFKYYKY